MLYRSLLGKTLPVSRVVSLGSFAAASPHRGALSASTIVLPSMQKNANFGSSSVVMAGSPLFVTDLSKQFDLSEIQFVLSEQVCTLFYISLTLFCRSILSSKCLERPKPVHGS